MNCRKSESLFSAFLEDELSQEERRALESHLLACGRCAESVRELQATMAAVQDLPVVSTTAFFEDDLMARIRSGEGLRPSVIEWLREGWSGAFLRPLLLAGAGACAIWIAVMLIGPGGPSVAPVGPIADDVARPGSMVEVPSATAPVADRSTTASGSRVALDAAPKSVHRRAAPGPEGRVLVERATPSSAGQSAPGAAVSNPRTVTTWAEGDLIPLFGLEDTTRLGRDPNYVDEYILDQFYLERSPSTGSSAPIVPVSGSPSDDVYITF